jgi:hypothetical protein
MTRCVFAIVIVAVVGGLALSTSAQTQPAAQPPRTLIPGDFNLDGKLTPDDAAAYNEMRADPRAYLARHHLTETDLLKLVDMNGDGVYDRADVDLFRQIIAKLQDQPAAPAAGSAPAAGETLPPGSRSPGDFDGDGKITPADVELAQEALDHPGRFLARTGMLTSDLRRIGDFNRDGKFDRVDIEALKRATANQPAAAKPAPTPPAQPKPDAAAPAAASGSPKSNPPTSSALKPTTGSDVPPLTPPTPEPGKQYQPAFELGMNLSPLNYYTTQWAFTNSLRQASLWLPQKSEGPAPFHTGAHLELKDGWPILAPGQAAAALLYRDIDSHFPRGNFVATWEGKGRLGFFFAAKLLKQEANLAVADFSGGAEGALLRIEESDHADPVRNLRIVPAELEHSDQFFHPVFLDRLRPFRVIRFMDWQMTNNPDVAGTWDKRTTPDKITQDQPSGVCLEYMIDLANTLGADPWFCIPHSADDEYIRQFATLIKQRLNADRKFYIEYSNEVWNWGFRQGDWIQKKGIEKGLGNAFDARLHYQSERSVEIFKIFEQVFGGRQRMVRVIASHAAVPQNAEMLLTWKNAYQHCDALAIAPYFGHDVAQRCVGKIDSVTVDDMLNMAADSIPSNVRDVATRNRAVARRFNIPLIAYEGGQHIAAGGGTENNKKLVDLIIAANRSPRMYDLYARMLQAWRQAGGGLFVAYHYTAQPSKWGVFGSLEYQDQPLDKAHKFRALYHATQGVLPATK